MNVLRVVSIAGNIKMFFENQVGKALAVHMCMCAHTFLLTYNFNMDIQLFKINIIDSK